ncbi:MAG: hypothetical protein CVT92_01600 [Bacteroidetes bacterium HGW-Bacteroidetes-1]|jgi:hypothetical protein|nr:MAG: hypothetical protein CVT92_01600 [Bacteroidetes bacterium HGW-Bacteroidetes-1]
MKNIFVVLLLVNQIGFGCIGLAQSGENDANASISVTNYETLKAKINPLDIHSVLLQNEVIGHSVEGKEIVAMKFSNGHFGSDPSKIKVLIFAQQHGNEQSGKEASLLLAEWLLKPENNYLLDRIDLALIPQMNPDGSEINRRRNANNADLNRNHLILSEPETQALHRFFDSFLFEVTLDVHEYSPYGEEWKEYGYRKNTDVAVGSCTNINVSKSIRKRSNKGFLPFVMDQLNKTHFKSFLYCPGGPPENKYIRHSTFDINDGRQSFGILNTFSFIQEGMNGTDMFAENMTFRAEGQKNGMIAMLKYVYESKDAIKKTVQKERNRLISEEAGKPVSIQAKHVANRKKLLLPLFSYATQSDTIVIVNDYRPVVKTITDVSKPLGYLIPKNQPELLSWAERHALSTRTLVLNKTIDIGEYFVNTIDSIDFEGDTVIDPVVVFSSLHKAVNTDDYVFIPTNQLKGNMIVIALEPKSMLGLVTYSTFKDLLKTGEAYPVLRVERK